MRNKRKPVKKDIHKIKFRQSIFGKLLLTMIGLLVSILVIFAFIQIQSEKELLVSKSDENIQVTTENLQKEARILSSNLGRMAEDSIAAYDFFTLFGVVQETVNLEPNLSYAILTDVNRHAFLHTDRPDLEQEVLDEPFDIFASEQQAPTYNEHVLDQIKYMEYVYPVKISTSLWGHLRLGFSLMPLEKTIKKAREEIDSQTKKIVYRSLLVSGLFIVFGIVIVYLMSKRISKPIGLLTKHADELSDGNYWFEPDKSLDTNDEVGKLSETFSLMANNIRDANEQLEDHNKVLEEKVREKTDELRGVENELNKMSSLVGKELKGPIHQVALLVAAIKKDTDSSFSAEGGKKMNVLIKSVNRLYAMVDGMQRYASVSQMEDDVSQVDMNALLNTVVERLQVPAHIAVNFDTKFPMIDFSASKLNIVLEQLISNAVRFNDKQEGLISIGCKARGEFWEFYVSDNGPGIPKSEHKSVFDLFKTLSGDEFSRQVGVGLSIAKKIIDSSNGKIWVDGDAIQGTTIKFILPQGASA